MPNPIGRALRNRRAGAHTLAWAMPGLAAPETFTLSSPAFDDGAPIPERYRGRLFAPNISPALSWSTPPAGTAELVLVIQDADVPFAKPATHGLAVGIDPASGGIPENGLAYPSTVAGIRLGNGPLGRRGWAGPAPIPSHGPHSYVFQLFAVEAPLELPDRFTLAQVVEALKGHVLARARLEGTYEAP